MVGYKLFRLRKDGTLGSLFIDARARIPLNVWLAAETHPKKGFAIRHGWHGTPEPIAPHLSEKGRVWAKCDFRGVTHYDRPESQGGTWILAEQMMVLEIVNKQEILEKQFASA